MNGNPHSQPRCHRQSRAALHRRRVRRAVRRVLCLAVVLAAAVGGTAFLLTSRFAAPSADAASAVPPASSAASATAQAAASSAAAVPEAPGFEGIDAAAAQAMLADPLMVLVNHTNKMPENYTFDTKECGSATAANKNLQTAACDAFLQMQAAAAADGVTVNMQSGYRTVAYQTQLYDRKTQYYLDKGFGEAEAREKAAAVVNPPGYSEHNCGLAADLNTPEHTALDEGFESTAAFRWLCEHAGEYGFILRYPKGRKDVTDVTYEPWHWRYVGKENAARINESGLVFEEYIAQLQSIAAAG